MEKEAIDTHSDSGQQLVLTTPITPAQIRAIIARMDSVIDLEKLADSTPFSEAGADSLDFFNIISEIQLATGLDIADEDIEQLSTLEGLASYLNARMS